MTDGKVVDIRGLRERGEEVALDGAAGRTGGAPGPGLGDDAGGGGDDAREHSGQKALDPRCPIIPLMSAWLKFPPPARICKPNP